MVWSGSNCNRPCFLRLSAHEPDKASSSDNECAGCYSHIRKTHDNTHPQANCDAQADTRCNASATTNIPTGIHATYS